MQCCRAKLRMAAGCPALVHPTGGVQGQGHCRRRWALPGGRVLCPTRCPGTRLDLTGPGAAGSALELCALLVRLHWSQSKPWSIGGPHAGRLEPLAQPSNPAAPLDGSAPSPVPLRAQEWACGFVIDMSGEAPTCTIPPWPGTQVPAALLAGAGWRHHPRLAAPHRHAARSLPTTCKPASAPALADACRPAGTPPRWSSKRSSR